VSAGCSIGALCASSWRKASKLAAGTIINLLSVSLVQEFMTSRTYSYLRKDRSRPNWANLSIKTKVCASISKQLWADSSRSCAVVEVVMGRKLLAFRYWTSTCRSPALTAETGASMPGKAVTLGSVGFADASSFSTSPFDRNSFMVSLSDRSLVSLPDVLPFDEITWLLLSLVGL